MQCGEYVLIEEVSAKEVVENKDNTKVSKNIRSISKLRLFFIFLFPHFLSYFESVFIVYVLYIILC